jgi:hypothetical protein
LTDGRGTLGFVLKLLALDEQGLDEDVVWQFDFEIEFSASELGLSKRVIAIDDLELPREGEYRFRLESNGEYVIQTRLLAIKENNNVIKYLTQNHRRAAGCARDSEESPG